MAAFQLRLTALAGALALLATAATARTLEVGEGKEFRAPSAAAKAARDGDVVKIFAGEYFDCAVWEANRLVVEGVGDAAKVVITDKACQGKALFITTGADVTIRNLTLTRARVPDANGAGIRGEGARLVVEGVRFINNQNGILTGFADGTVIVRDSVFERNGTCEKACAHGIYVGRSKLLQVERSRFTDTRQGHHIKSRAVRTEVTGNTIVDGPDGTASYLIDVPNGGSLIVRDNTMEKGPVAENRSTAISIGAEGVDQPTRELLIENNTFNNAGSYDTLFVTNLTATDAVVRANRITGRAKPLRGDGQVTAAR
ncbi:MAG: right-handed parallel beta-helix repeat-containing protein [Gemmatimonadaceae bacterium]|nr:right-handed parallel beta-helix repeat-containing protein [Acetobacteraceae bacterium]